jgi:hypothetical protein
MRGDCINMPVSNRLLRLRTLRHPCISFATLILVGACQRSDARSAIEVDRQVLLDGVAGKPTAIITGFDGGLIVVGAGGTAWAVGTNTQGEPAWRFEYRSDESTDAVSQSRFSGAVALANGRVLLCGQRTSPDGVGLITILDSNGHVVDRRTEPSNGDATLKLSGITHCVHWNDGVALIGWSGDGSRGSPWITKLDNRGVKLWSRAIPNLPAGDVVETSDHCLVLTTFNSSTFEVELAKVDGKGEVVARTTIKANDYIQLHTVEPTRAIALLTYGEGTALTMHKLNERLEETTKATKMGNFDAMQGRGYVLPDNSIALFGRTDNAAIAWISATGRQLALSELDRKYKSFVIADAVPIPGDRFVTVQESVMQNHGLVLSWVTLKTAVP